jgi:hypothetical protein
MGIPSVVRKARKFIVDDEKIHPMVIKFDYSKTRWTILGVIGIVVFAAVAASVILLFA